MTDRRTWSRWRRFGGNGSGALRRSFGFGPDGLPEVRLPVHAGADFSGAEAADYPAVLRVSCNVRLLVSRCGKAYGLSHADCAPGDDPSPGACWRLHGSYRSLADVRFALRTEFDEPVSRAALDAMADRLGGSDPFMRVSSERLRLQKLHFARVAEFLHMVPEAPAKGLLQVSRNHGSSAR